MRYARFKTVDGYLYEVIVCGRSRVYSYVGRGRNCTLHPSSRRTVNAALGRRVGPIIKGNF